MKKIIIRKASIKLTIALILSIIWDTSIKTYSSQNIIEYPIAFFSMLFFTLAWFCYLKLDGLNTPKFYVSKKNKNNKKHKMKQMIDYIDTNLDDSPELTDEQLLKSKLYANIFSAIILLTPVIYSMLFN